jgi:hypothetical protein
MRGAVLSRSRGASEQDLTRELSELSDRHPALADDSLFVLWFLRAFVTDSESDAAQALTGGPRDKGIDAVYIDEPAKTVVIIQGKYRKEVAAKLEGRQDVMALAALPRALNGDGREFSSFIQELDPLTSSKLSHARERIVKRKYGLQLHYVSMGRFSHSLVEEARRVARSSGDKVALNLIGGREVLLMLSDYLDGVAPPVPALDIEIERGHGVKIDGPFQRYDGRTDIESWVFSVRAQTMGDLYSTAGIRLFARNVRGFLGSTDINRGMQDTLRKEPDYFWYYNNGITVVCDEAQLQSGGGREILRVMNPQVINGQQTTRVLHEVVNRGSRASVLMRVIRIPRGGSGGVATFETLVSRIVAATNWQNAIRPSDLMSNDRRQIEIERQLRKLGYHYVRKRQTKGEARRAAGMRHRFLIRKEELAQAVAAADLDPATVRLGKERLFEERYYSQVFPTSDPFYYLMRYWTTRLASYSARGFPERAYAKWLVVHHLWDYLSQLMRSRALSQAFLSQAEKTGAAIQYFDRAAELTFKEALRFYRRRRGKGETATDVSSFFRLRNLHGAFARHWRGGANRSRRGFQQNIKRFLRILEEAVSGG